MKTIPGYNHILAILAVGVMATQMASGQTELWTGGGADQNWSTPGNWSGGVVPGSATNVIFTNNTTAASSPGTVDNIVDSGFAGTVASLQFINTNVSTGAGFYHTTQIGAGQTLSVLGNLTVGNTPWTNIMNAAFIGAGTLVVSNGSAGINVSQGDAGNASSATLIMTNLNMLNASIGGITVGKYNTPNQAIARQKGILYLAKTNIINFIGNAPKAYSNEGQIEVGQNLGNGSNLQVPMYLGIMNTINVNTITIGGDKQGSGALLAFAPVFTNLAPVANISGTNGAGSRVTTWKVADNSNQSTTGSGTAGTVDFSGGYLNALVSTLIVGEGESGASSGTGNGVGTFTFNEGTNNVNTLYLGYRVATGGSSAPSGTMNVNGSAVLVANNAICLSYYVANSGSTYASGTLNINGGTVLASTITNGVVAGANTTANINMTGGFLGISSLLGSIGTATAPLKAITLSGATLQLPVSGLQTNVVVSALTLSGTTNYINISTVPATTITYPSQFPLIAYNGSIAGTFNIGISNLPGTYQGYISNNTANSSIDLVLTSGPTSVSSLVWQGTANGSWDFSSVDWLSGSSPVAYFDGAAVIFNDTATGPTGINIPAMVSPAGMTFNNSSLPYSFSGAGVGGSGALTMNGNGTILFTNSGNTFAGGINVNSGSVQFGNGGTSGTIPATGNILDNGNLIIDRSGSVIVPNAISGSGTITENGASVLSLNASNTFSGVVNVSSGTLLVNGVLPGSVNSSLGSTVGGSGTNSGAINAGGVVQPSASSGTPATFTSGALNLSSGATLAFDLAGNNTTVGSGINDLLSVNGGFTANNNNVALNFQGVPVPGNTYTLVNFSGSKSGSLNPVITGTHFNATLNQGSSPITVTLNGSGANLKWDATIAMANNQWNLGGASNWLNLGTSLQDVFYQGDTVIFDDSVAGVTNLVTIPSGVVVSPAVISDNSSSVNYTIAGPGQISGNVTVIKQGSSTLTLSGANVNYTGTNYIEGGTLQVGNGNAFGSAGTAVVTNGGTLDLNNQGIGNVPVIISGSGVGGNGAIINSVYTTTGDQHALDTVKLSGDATIGGIGRWDIRVNGTQNALLTTSDGHPHNLTKVGTNMVALVTCTIDSSIGNIDVQNGTLALQLAGTAQNSPGWFGSGTANRTISVENGGTLEFNTLGSAYPLYQNLVLNNGSTLLSDAGNNAISGNVTLNGNATISVTGGTSPWLYITGVIGGSGNLIVNGTLPLVISSASTYTGNTFVNSGTLELGFGFGVDGSIFNSSNIIVAANAVLDASQESDQTLTVPSGQNLLGNGGINGDVIVSAGGTILAGTNFTAIGSLTLSNDLTLQGNAFIKLNPGAATNDFINVTNGAITYGGTLILANISGSYAVGNNFQIFGGASYSGAFSSIVPATPGNGLAWNTNNLATSGVLSIVAGTFVPQPGITSITLSGNQLVISGTNGVSGQQYSVLESTNLLTPLSNWTPISTNTFSGSAFNVTNTVNPHAPQNFYLIRVP
ncbi:MAG TPA: autotransporter-associated beta strand repeat-containing protein [Pseudomonadales bacterium]|nr:autotransporter-associated beta strand repeat-containing protein [Pseudomonadales bacterium]